MGQYLKDAYEERDLAKALAKAHGLIDAETKKLSDKLENLTLSYNRKKRALRIILGFCNSDCGKKTISPGIRICIIETCKRALLFDGRF